VAHRWPHFAWSATPNTPRRSAAFRPLKRGERGTC
jgi:hypothetical protein